MIVGDFVRVVVGSWFLLVDVVVVDVLIDFDRFA